VHTSLGRSLTILLTGALLLGLAAAAPQETAAPAQPDKDGFYNLFDGKSLDGWKIGKNAES